MSGIKNTTNVTNTIKSWLKGNWFKDNYHKFMFITLMVNFQLMNLLDVGRAVVQGGLSGWLVAILAAIYMLIVYVMCVQWWPKIKELDS